MMIKQKNDAVICRPTDREAIIEEEMIKVLYDDYGSNSFDGLTMFEPSTDEFYIHINTARGNRPNKGGLFFSLS